MLGSGAFAGEHDMDFALSRADAAGRTVGEELERIGYRGEHPVAPYPLHAAFEAQHSSFSLW
jgi:N-carbamoyl-L-amino-acid hydrolase